MKVYELDKIVAQGVDFPVELYRALVITHVGTNAVGEGSLRIDAKLVGLLRSTLAPLHKVTGNMAGLLPLGPHYLVVPPGKVLRYDAAAGEFLRIKGKLLELGVGEALPAEYASRFANQHNEYIRCFLGATRTTPVGWPDGGEILLDAFAPTVVEEFTFNNRFYCEQVTSGTPAEAEGNVGVRLYMDGAPLDWILPATGRRGLARFSLDIPSQALNRELEPFTLEGSPVVVPPGKVFDARIMNVSGATLFGTAAASFRLLAAFVYKKAA